MTSNPWGGSTEYSITSSYYLPDVQSYSQYVTLAGGVSGTPINVNVTTPTGTEYLSTVLTNAYQVYSLSSVNNFTSIEFYNNTENSIIFVDMAGLLTTMPTLSASGIVIRPLVYYYFAKPVVSNQIKVVTDTPISDLRVICHGNF